MIVHVIMRKLSENDEIVSYRFETDIADGYYLSKSGNLRRTLKDVYGYCEFNKTTEKFILDKDKSDPYFFEDPYYEGVNYEVFKVWTRLVKQKMKGEGFPDIIEIAC